MKTQEITYGIGGYCENCDPVKHNHPLNNLINVEEFELSAEEQEQIERAAARESALAKLAKLGLTPEEIAAL